MEVSSEKSKVLANSTNKNIPINIMMKVQNVEEVDSFKYFGSTLSKVSTSTKETKIRIAVVMSVMSRLNTISNSRHQLKKTKLKLYRLLGASILFYGCESWTQTAETERRVQAFETKCVRKFVFISYTEHKSNGCVRQQVNSFAGKHEPLLAAVKRRKRSLFGHFARHNTIVKNTLQGTLEDKRQRSRQREQNWTT